MCGSSNCRGASYAVCPLIVEAREPSLLLLPASGQEPSVTTTVSSEGPVVVVGANGSGKTRLGVWVEFDSAQKNRVRRLSAQKSLSMPQTVAAPSVEKAREHLIFGQDLKAYFGLETWPEDVAPLKFRAKWNGRPSTHLSDDFGYLLEYLFAEEQEISTKYRQEAGQTEVRIEPPETKLDRIKRVWEEVLPHRRLEIGGSRIDAAPSDNPSAVYAPTDMSDGERVVFYLIGQALSAPEDGILLIDEPELHLHRSIQATLWDKIEAERPDCLFVYLTHDLDFAASRVAATRICLKGYDGQRWEWFEIPENKGIPEETLLEILGSRKPIIFVEGDRGSLDYFLYQNLYPGFTIAPCGGADGVIHATVSFSSFEELHRHTAYGIIDRDFRHDEEVERLQILGIFSLEYSEVENQFLTEEVLRIIANHQHQQSEFDTLLEQSKSIVFREMSNNRETLISSITASKVERQLRDFNAKARGKEELEEALVTLSRSIDVGDLYNQSAADIDGLIAARDYDRALRTYNNKGLLPQIARVFGFDSKGLMTLVKNFIASGQAEELVEVLRRQAPSVPT